MLGSLIDWFRSLSVRVKLTGTLVLVVLFTTLVLTLILAGFSQSYLDLYAQNRLSSQFERAVRVVRHNLFLEVEATEALTKTWSELGLGLAGGARLYALGEDGMLLLPGGADKAGLPTDTALMGLLGLGQGRLSKIIAGQKNWLAFQRLSSGVVVVLQAPHGELIAPAMNQGYHLITYTVVALVLLVGLGAVVLSRVVLSTPLLHLTESAERVAAGDLTPPEPLQGRQDELGRLSLALNRMTITARGMVEEAQASQARFRQLFTESRDATFMIDEQGRIEDVNPAALRIFGYEKREAMQALSDTRGLFYDSKERQHYLGLLAEEGYVKDYPATMRRKDGVEFEAQITATMRGTTARFGQVRDVTQMRAAQRALLESEERYRRLIENAPDIIYRWSVTERGFDYISPAVETIFGYAPHEMLIKPELAMGSVHPAFLEKVREHWRGLNHGDADEATELEYKIIHRSGETRWLRERTVVVRNRQGQVIAVEGLSTDITVQKQVEQALLEGQRMVETTLQGLPAAIMVIDRDHKVVHWNRAMERLTGVKAEEMVGTTRTWHPFYKEPRPVLVDLIMDMDWDRMKEYYGDGGLKASVLIGGGLECEGFYSDLGGHDRHLYFLAAPILDEDNRVVRAIETLIDLTDKRELEEELRRLSVTDDLTRLYNQRFFYATLAREVEATRRYGQKLSLLLMDLDKFKDYNDTYGHLEGDRVLTACAQAVQEQVRATDIACRYGGEEFVVLLPHTPLDEALKVAERIRVGVESLEFYPVVHETGICKAQTSMSIGAAAFGGIQTSQDLVRRADHAMYEAKIQGRNRVAVYLKGGDFDVLEPGVSYSRRAEELCE